MGEEKFLKILCSCKKSFLDSSPLIYHLEGIEPYLILTKRLLTKIAEGELANFISFLSIAELLTMPIAQKDNVKLQLCEEFIQNLPNTNFADLNFEIAKQSAIIRAKHNLRIPDAFLIAQARFYGADIFITNDKNFKKASSNNLQVLLLDEFV